MLCGRIPLSAGLVACPAWIGDKYSMLLQGFNSQLSELSQGGACSLNSIAPEKAECEIHRHPSNLHHLHWKCKIFNHSHGTCQMDIDVPNPKARNPWHGWSWRSAPVQPKSKNRSIAPCSSSFSLPAEREDYINVNKYIYIHICDI